MTRSELHALCAGGFATIAGAELAIYASFGVGTCILFMELESYMFSSYM